jgi:hypothetical protein
VISEFSRTVKFRGPFSYDVTSHLHFLWSDSGYLQLIFRNYYSSVNVCNSYACVIPYSLSTKQETHFNADI